MQADIDAAAVQVSQGSRPRVAPRAAADQASDQATDSVHATQRCQAKGGFVDPRMQAEVIDADADRARAAT